MHTCLLLADIFADIFAYIYICIYFDKSNQISGIAFILPVVSYGF